MCNLYLCLASDYLYSQVRLVVHIRRILSLMWNTVRIELELCSMIYYVDLLDHKIPIITSNLL